MTRIASRSSLSIAIMTVIRAIGGIAAVPLRVGDEHVARAEFRPPSARKARTSHKPMAQRTSSTSARAVPIRPNGVAEPKVLRTHLGDAHLAICASRERTRGLALHWYSSVSNGSEA